MDAHELLHAIRRGATADSLETERLEFKQAAPALKSTLHLMADAVVCLANAAGGHIVLGVADRGNADEAILGVPEELSLDVLAHGVFDRTSPPLSVAVEDVTDNGKRVARGRATSEGSRSAMATSATEPTYA